MGGRDFLQCRFVQSPSPGGCIMPPTPVERLANCTAELLDLPPAPNLDRQSLSLRLRIGCPFSQSRRVAGGGRRYSTVNQTENKLPLLDYHSSEYSIIARQFSTTTRNQLIISSSFPIDFEPLYLTYPLRAGHRINCCCTCISVHLCMLLACFVDR